MLAKLSSYLRFGTTFCGIEVTTQESDTHYFSTIAKQNKGEFIDFQFNEGKSLSELATNFSKSQHSQLVINTDKVLIKEGALGGTSEQIVSQTFPSLKLDAFYYEILKTSTKSFVAVCRKDYVEKILKEFSLQNVTIIGFRLGFGLLDNVIPLIKENAIQISNATLYTEKNEVSSFTSETSVARTYQVEDVSVSSNYLISLSSLFGYITNTNQFQNSASKNTALAKTYSEKNFFKKGLYIGIFTLLILMLVNMIAFTSYFKELDMAKLEAQVSKSQRALFSKKQELVKEKEQVVKNLLNNGNSKSSYYINTIVVYKPASMLFDAFVYQPLTRTIRPDKKIDYSNSELFISGDSTDKNEFSQWIEQLEQQAWIDEVTVVNYGIQSTTTDSFEVSIKIRDEAKN